ncbi:Catalase CatB [Mycobacteroides abscessus subsp. abscessus]|nr:Catalase CatB [Mycobacteroides abscessus subsp. abscessus]
MPKTTSKGRAKQSELPDTLRKSSDKAQRTFAKVDDGVVTTTAEANALPAEFVAAFVTAISRHRAWERETEMVPA